MYDHRTLITRAGYVGIIGCCLVGTPALAAVNSNGIEILSTSATGVKTGQYIEAAASVRYQHVNTAQRIYTRALVPVSRATLRTGALAVLSAGRLLPGLGLAATAAGFVISNSSQTPEIGVETESTVNSPTNTPVYTGSVSSPYNASGAVINYCSYTGSSPSFSCPNGQDFQLSWSYDSGGEMRYRSVAFNCSGTTWPSGAFFNFSPTSGSISAACFASHDIDGTLADLDEPTFTPVSDTELTQLDEHLPPEIITEIYNDSATIPDWQDQITVLGGDSVKTDGNVAPEVVGKALSWAQNVAAQLDGEPLPNPDTETDTKTAEEAAYEDQLKSENEPVPPFTDPEVNWQTEELELPAYSSGIGGGVCPPPVSIPMPLGVDTLEWSYQPACDVAEMVRPAFLGACGLIALMIVLRARGGEG